MSGELLQGWYAYCAVCSNYEHVDVDDKEEAVKYLSEWGWGRNSVSDWICENCFIEEE